MPINSAGPLEKDLLQQLDGEVRFDAGARALYATDGSNYRQVPIGVVIPRTKDDILKTITLCRKHDAPLLSRGAGTSLAGQCCNAAVVMDMSKYYNRILEVDPLRRFARIQPGVILDSLRRLAHTHGLTFGPDPATHAQCTLGGMIGNNSCGVHGLMAGKTVDNVERLLVHTYDGLTLDVGATSENELAQIIAEGGRRGDIYAKLKSIRDRFAPLIRARFPRISRRVSGYNLDELLPENGFNVARTLVGTEGTCVTVLEATLALIPWPPFRSLVVLGYPDVYTAASSAGELLASNPQGLEGFDEEMLINFGKDLSWNTRLELLPQGKAWLLVEFGGQSQEEADAKASAIAKTNFKLYQDSFKAKEIWTVRESALAATAIIPNQKDRYEGWEDTAVPPEKLAPYLRDLRALYNRYGYQGAFYGHFGQGCIHSRISFDLDTQEGIRQFRSFVEEAADLVVGYGGSLSGEHGDGHARAELLPKMFGPELVGAFKEFKAVWDPQNKMNPGKIVDPYRMTDHLRYGAAYTPAPVETNFQFSKDQNRFDRAVLRCVGVGKCRRDEGGVMCPSYRATHDEKDSPRGRAHMLFEMLQGDALKGVWKNEHVKDALDLCLSCKGCKSDCPVNVDIATYKAEFLSHYYEGRLRPREAYAFGWVNRWVSLASRMPSIANFLTQTRGLRKLARRVAGMAPQRTIPPLALRTFRELFRARQTKKGGQPVLLWPDTFNNHFHPQVMQAAVEVLEHYGFEVRIPARQLCCGRPLYDYGFLGMAKKQLQEILEALRADIRAGIPLIGLEPSCVAVFRDELLQMLPGDPDAQQLSRQTFLFSEFLIKKAEGIKIPAFARQAIAQAHCHDRAITGFGAEEELYRRMGLKVSIPESSCCGMAGAFGFEADHYDLSRQCGERSLLPAVRKTSEDTLVIASGFSCREQISQLTGREPLHLAEVLRMALKASS